MSPFITRPVSFNNVSEQRLVVPVAPTKYNREFTARVMLQVEMLQQRRE